MPLLRALRTIRLENWFIYYNVLSRNYARVNCIENYTAAIRTHSTHTHTHLWLYSMVNAKLCLIQYMRYSYKLILNRSYFLAVQIMHVESYPLNMGNMPTSVLLLRTCGARAARKLARMGATELRGLWSRAGGVFILKAAAHTLLNIWWLSGRWSSSEIENRSHSSVCYTWAWLVCYCENSNLTMPAFLCVFVGVFVSFSFKHS